MTSVAAAPEPVTPRSVSESRFAAEARAMPLADFKLVHQDFSREEVQRRLDAGADPGTLALNMARLAYVWGHFEGYNEGRTHAFHEMAVEAIQRRRAGHEV